MLIAATVARIINNSQRGVTTELAAWATTLLWLRVIQYLAGFERTAPCKYSLLSCTQRGALPLNARTLRADVQMTLAVTGDMASFLLMLLILVAGNVFTMQLLYPQSLQDDMSLSETDRSTIDEKFKGWGHAIFNSMEMLFAGSFDKSLLDKAYSSSSAYVYFGCE